MKKWLALLLAAAMALSVTLAGFAESDESDGSGAEKSSAESSAKSESKPKAESSASKSGESKASESKASESSSSESKASESKSSESRASESSSSESKSGESKSTDSTASEGSSSESKSGESKPQEAASEGSAGSSTGSEASKESVPAPADGAASDTASSGESALTDAASGGSADGESASADTSDGEAPSETADAESSGSASDATGEASAPKSEAEETEDSGLTAAQIRSVQSWLIQLDYLAAGHVTGVYDDATRSAVKRFQADNGLSATGECSAATYSAIARKAAAASGGTASDGAETSPEDAAEGIGDEAFNGESLGGGFVDGAVLAPARDYGNADDADEIDATGSLSEAQSQKVQAWLTELGYLTDDEEAAELTDEAVAEAIAAAVAQFQAENGLEVTDACDAATYRLIYEKFLELASSEEGEGGGGPGGPGGGPGGFHGFGGRSRGGRGYRGGVGGMGGAGLGGEPEDDPLNGITPGEALTSTHRSGDKDDTLYGALASLEEAGLDIALSTGPSEAELSPAGIEDASAGNGSLRLYGGDSAVQRWTLNGMTLRTLARSGIDALTLAGDGGSVTLKTSGLLTGSVYSALRARGQTDNTFEYTVTLSGGAASVTAEAGGTVYAAVIRDGALTLVKPDSGEA